MATTTAAGLGKDLRNHPKVNFDPSNQTAICGTPFDPIAGDCCILESFSTWCFPCVKLIPVLMKHALHYKNIPVLQVSPEEPEKLKKFFSGVKVPYSVSAISRHLWDDLGDVFDIQGIPHLIVFYQGSAVFSGHPADPLLEPLLKKYNAMIAEEKKAAAAAATLPTVENANEQKLSEDGDGVQSKASGIQS